MTPAGRMRAAEKNVLAVRAELSKERERNNKLVAELVGLEGRVRRLEAEMTAVRALAARAIGNGSTA